MSNSGANSSRIRTPWTGRSNLNSSSSSNRNHHPDNNNNNSNGQDNGINASSKSVSHSPRSHFQRNRLSTAPGNFSSTTLSSTFSFLQSDSTLPPILARNDDPTIPPVSPRKKKNLSCPESWIKNTQELSWLERADNRTNFDFQGKQTYTRDFIERNQDQLWKFDSNYRGKTPHAVCDELVNNKNFVSLMRAYKVKEQSINLTSSRNMAESIQGYHQDNNTQVLSMSRRKPQRDVISSDPYIMTLQTSRNERYNKHHHLFDSNSYKTVPMNHRKGYNHAPDYGNFSRYCGVLKSNEGATLKR